MKNLVCDTSISDEDQDYKGKKLVDYSATGKERPWRKWKKQTHILAEAYFWSGYDRKAIRIEECGTYLEFKECPYHQEEKVLSYANFCRERLCPMCQWRRSMKLAWQVNNICHLALLAKPKLRFLVLNLSAKNVPAGELRDEISDLMYSFRKLKGRKEVDRVLEGYFRAIEVTYNSDQDTYHPHFHCILAVKPSYFKGQYYIKHSRWVELWRQSLKVGYDPQVYVKPIKRRKGKSTLEKHRKQYNDDVARAVAETGKYSVKPESYIQEGIESTSEVVGVLEEALKHRRMVSYGGMLKKIREKLNAEDVEGADVDLVRTGDDKKECECAVCGSDLIDYVYHWNIGVGDYLRK